MLSPLLADGLDPAKAKQLRKMICEQKSLFERSIRGIWPSIKEEFEGLKPKSKERTSPQEGLSPQLLKQEGRQDRMASASKASCMK